MISSHIPYENFEYNQREHWFGTRFTTIPMPSKWLAMWNDSQVLNELIVPQANPFIATDFTLHWHQSGKPHIPRRPRLLQKNDLCEMWFRQDDTFQLPDGCINLYFIIPVIQKSAKSFMIGVLFTYLVEFSMVEQLYPALLAGLSYSLYMGKKGLMLSARGYNQKLPLIVEIIVNVMHSLDLVPSQVTSFKELKKRQLFNALINGKLLNLDLRLSVLDNLHFSLLQKYESIDNITFDDIQNFKHTFYQRMYIQAHFQGNFEDEQAHLILNKVLYRFNSQRIDSLLFLENCVVQLPLGSHYLRVKTLNEDDTNTAITNYYQIGPSSLTVECLMDLVELIVEEPYFNQLRTLEQLSYSLGLYQRVGHGVVAYVITINTQETTHKADFVEGRIEAFRARIPEIVSQLSDQEFNEVVETLISIKRLGDTSLSDEVTRNWDEIVTMEYFFNHAEMQIQTLRGLSKQHVLDFLYDFDKSNFRKLSVQVIGRSTRPTRLPTQTISEAVAGRESLINPLERRPGLLSGLLDEVQRNISDEQLLFEQIGDRIKIDFIGRQGDSTNIMNISAFKKNLPVYPWNPKHNIG